MANSLKVLLSQAHTKDFHSFSPPARWGLLDFIRAHARLSSSSTSCPPRPPPRLRLFHLHFRLANLATRRQALRQLPAQCALLDVNLRAAQLSVHRWTSTCELPSSVCTAGPQPASCPAQCAPLDLNRGPAELSVHRWTSTGDLPSSVCTAGIQQPDRMPEDVPDRMPDRMPEGMPDKMPWDMPDRMPEDMPDRIPEDLPDDMLEEMPNRYAR